MFFRTLKKSLGCAKLRSRASRRARLEMMWALMALMITTMLGIDAAGRRRITPNRLSPMHLIRTLRRYLSRSPRSPSTLSAALVSELQDDYQRKRPKRSRHAPITKNTPRPLAPKPPKIRKATQEEQKLAAKFKINESA